jgi:hypothetical protein
MPTSGVTDSASMAVDNSGNLWYASGTALLRFEISSKAVYLNYAGFTGTISGYGGNYGYLAVNFNQSTQRLVGAQSGTSVFISNFTVSSSSPYPLINQWAMEFFFSYNAGIYYVSNVLFDSSNNIYAVAYTGDRTYVPNNNFITIIKTNSSGTLQWARGVTLKITDPGNNISYPGTQKMTATLSGNFIYITAVGYGVMVYYGGYSYFNVVLKIPIDGSKTGTYTVTTTGTYAYTAEITYSILSPTVQTASATVTSSGSYNSVAQSAPFNGYSVTDSTPSLLSAGTPL